MHLGNMGRKHPFLIFSQVILLTDWVLSTCLFLQLLLIMLTYFWNILNDDASLHVAPFTLFIVYFVSLWYNDTSKIQVREDYFCILLYKLYEELHKAIAQQVNLQVLIY